MGVIMSVAQEFIVYGLLAAKYPSTTPDAVNQYVATVNAVCTSFRSTAYTKPNTKLPPTKRVRITVIIFAQFHPS